MPDFGAFFGSSYQSMVRTLLVAFSDDSGVEDAIGEAFARAYSKWPTVGLMERPGTWV